MKKILLIWSCLLSSFFSYSQDIEISLQQDARLLLIGDSKANNMLTLNILTKLEIPIIKLTNKHISIYPSIEYADLVGGNFQRYAIGVSYHMSKIYPKIGATAFFDIGNIYRQNSPFLSYSITGELSYRIHHRVKIIGSQQVTQRNDLKTLYNNKNEFLISGFFGVKISL
jgi:hypothetical protein